MPPNSQPSSSKLNQSHWAALALFGVAVALVWMTVNEGYGLWAGEAQIVQRGYVPIMVKLALALVASAAGAWRWRCGQRHIEQLNTKHHDQH